MPELYPELGEAVVLDVELAELEALASEGAYHADAGEVFLHHGGELALGLVGCLEARGDAAVEEPGAERHDGYEGERHQRQFGVHGEHGPEVDGDGYDRADDVHELGADEGAHDLDVGGAALYHLAGLVCGVPGEGQALDVGIELVAYALDEALRTLGEEEALPEDGEAA